MIEKDLVLLIALPFISVLVATLIGLAENPFGTIHGIYKFQISIYDKIFSRSSNGSET